MSEQSMNRISCLLGAAAAAAAFVFRAGAADIPKPYSPPCMERENVFAFTQRPAVRLVSKDRYEITFAVKANCDATVDIVDDKGIVVRHLASGVLGPNAPAPFQKNSLSQKIYWNGKCDLGRYPRNTEKLKVRVMLGLKPVFDKRLGGTSGHNLPSGTWGIAIDETGAYVFAFNGGGFNHGSVRRFGLDGKYLNTVFPPPASMPLEKTPGMSSIEYEPGKRARHGNNLHDSIAGNGGVMRGATGSQSATCQIALAGNRLVYLGIIPSVVMHYVYKDGTTDISGAGGMRITGAGGLDRTAPFLAASPDGKWVYMVAVKGLDKNVVYCKPADGSDKHKVFAGTPGKPGSSNAHLNGPTGIDCDSKGRVYVSDTRNNRIQVFSPEGKYLRSIKMDRPGLIRVHQKTGAIYVQHPARIQGKSVNRLTKFVSFDNPKEEFHQDGIGSTMMALDSWSARPRLWLGGEVKSYEPWSRTPKSRHSVRIHEEDGKKFKMVFDFGAEVRKEGGDSYSGGWGGNCFDKIWCDPTREQAYYAWSRVFDLKTGKFLGTYPKPCAYDDAAFDKHGYMHLHFNPTFFGQGVGRVDPSRVNIKTDNAGRKSFSYPECPYDYGVEARGWAGILPTKDQGGAKGFQDGLGVNMRGDVVSQCNIYYVPKYEDEIRAEALAGDAARLKSGVWSEEANSYNRFMKKIQDAAKRGEEIYSIRFLPGSPLHGGTAWTWDRFGELIQDSAVVAGDLINGTQMDEDLSVYFVNARPKAYQEKPFLFGRAGIIGAKSKKGSHPFTGTLIKTKPGAKCKVMLARAPVPLEPKPKRPPDLIQLNFMDEAYMGKGSWCWVEGGEWIYAGAGPLTSVGCSCPRMHQGLDWYKRTYLPEGYRHSIAILDTNGNLIMHLGRYGNFDDAPGGKNGAKPGGADIGLMSVRFISATDNYLVFGDWCERLLVLKLAYHVEETVPVEAR